MNRMTLSRAIVGFTMGLCLVAGAPAQAKSAKSAKAHSVKAHKHAHHHGGGLSFHAPIKALKFSDLDGWQKDDWPPPSRPS